MAAERYEPEARRLTPEEYLERERKAEFKSELFDGYLIAMAGAQRAHVRIAVRLLSWLDTALRGTPCEPFDGDMRVRIDAQGHYYYPDVSVACEPQFADANFDVLLNPMVVIEVLSPSTQAHDRTGKWEHYQRLASLREYVLVFSTTPRVEVYSRRDDGKWLFQAVEGLQENIALESIEVTLSLAEVYERVTFETREYSQEIP